jgi:hypothetical protein
VKHLWFGKSQLDKNQTNYIDVMMVVEYQNDNILNQMTSKDGKKRNHKKIHSNN